MDWLEEELKRAMAREDAPPGFASRTIDRARARKVSTLPRWLASAAAIVLVAGGVYGYHWRQGVQAKDQLMLAFKITAVQMNRIQTQVREAGQ